MRDMLNRLYVLRHGQRISQMRLAKALGIPFYRYWKIENDFAEPSAEDRAKLAAYFQVADIFQDTPTPPPPDSDADDAAHA